MRSRRTRSERVSPWSTAGAGARSALRALVVRVLLLVASWPLTGCEMPHVVGVTLGGGVYVPVRLAENEDLDVLFVVGNSASMGAKQARLRAALPTVLSSLTSRGVIHFGAVTADLGAGSLQGFGCRPDGDGARPVPVGAAADPSRCPGTRDGRSFFERDVDAGRDNLMPGQSLADALDCMLAAGEAGCPVQQPLQAALDAIGRSMAVADGFVRPEALLLVVLLTDGDDCSLPAGSDPFASDGGQRAPDTFDCARWGVEYGYPPRPIPDAPSGGPLPMPVPAAPGFSGRLVDVSAFRDFFTRPRSLGGVKDDPNDVLVMTISGPPEPFEIVSLRAGTERTPSPVACQPPDGQQCILALKHACAAEGAPALFGDPAVRLRAATGAVQHGYAASVCAADQTQALGDVVRLVQAQQRGAGCLPAQLGDAAYPDCLVDEEVQRADGSIEHRVIPPCAQAGEARPCWRIRADRDCAPITGPDGGRIEQYRIEIDRGTQPPSDRSWPHAACAMAPG